MSLKRKARRWLAVSSAAAATALTLVPPAMGANTPSQYTGGATAQQPASGNFSNGFTPTITAGGSATLELDFSNSGSNSFSANDDLSGALNLNEIQLNSTSTGMGSITATAGDSLNFVVNGTVNPTILQDNIGQWTLGAPMSIAAAANPLTFGGTYVNGATGPVVTGNVFVTGALSGAGGVVFSGIDNTFLQAPNTYTGTTTLNSGTLTLDFSAATAPTNGNILYNGVTPAAFIMAGGNLALIGSGSTAETQTFGGLTLGGGGGSIVVNNGAGGATTLNLGAITATAGAGVDFSGTGSVIASNANTGGILGGWATFNRGATWAVGNAASPITGLATYTANYTTAGANVDATASGTMTGLTVNSVRFNTAAAVTLTVSGTGTLTTGGILVTPTVGNVASTITGGTITTAATTGFSVQEYDPSSSLTISSVIAGANGLVKDGPGTLIIGGTVNTFTGDVYINGGTLQITGSNGNATSGPLGIFTGGTSFKRVVLNNDAIFAISTSYNSNVPTSALPGNGQVFVIGTGGGQFSVASGQTLTIDDGSGAGVATTNSELQGTGDLTKIGPGTLSLGNGTSNFSVFTGQIFIDAGTVQMGSGGTFQLGSTSAGTFVNSTGVLNLNNANIGAEPLTLNGSTAAGVLVNNATGGTGTATGPITLAGASNTIGGVGNLTLSGIISGGSFTKVGTGNVNLSGANLFTGGTTVSAGTLTLTNGATGSATGTGAISVAAGATLASLAGGKGTASGAASGPASGTATIAPGGFYPVGGVTNSTLGALNLGGLNATADTALTFDLNNPTTAGSTYDTINVLNPDAFTVTGNVPIVLGQLPATTGTYHLISFNSSSTPSFDGTAFTTQAASGNGRVTYTVTVDPAGGNNFFVDLNAAGSATPITTVFNNPTPVLDSLGNADWTQAANWSNGAAGIAGDTATINNGATSALTIDLNGQQHVASLTFANSATGSYTLAAGNGGTLYLDNGTSTGTVSLTDSTNSNTITAPLVLTNNATVSVTSPNVLALAGATSGNGKLTMAGPSELVLGNPAINVATTTTSGSASVTVPTTNGLAIGQTLNGAGIPAGTTITAINSGTNTLTLSATATATATGVSTNYYFANTYSGGTTATGGTIQLANPSGLGTAAAVFNSGTTLDINNFNPTNALTVSGTGFNGAGVITNTSGTSNPTMSGTVALAADSTFKVPNNYVISGVVSGAHVLTVLGPGQISLNGSNTFSAGLIVGAGNATIVPATGGATPVPPSITVPDGFIATGSGDLGFGAANTTVTLNNGSNVYINVAAQVNDTHTFLINGTVAMGNKQNQKYDFPSNNAVSGPGTAAIIRYTQGGVGVTTTNDFQLTGNNSGYSGAWYLEGGATEVQNIFALGNNAPTNIVTMYNATGPTAATAGSDEIASNNMPQAIIAAGPFNGGNVLGGDNGATLSTATYSGPITLDFGIFARMGAYFATTSQNLAFTNTVSGPGAITFLAPNGGALNGQELILSGNNIAWTGTFNSVSGAVAVPAGVAVVAASPNALGSATSSGPGTGDLANTITLASGAALDIQAAIPSTEKIAPVSGTGIGGTGVIRNTGPSAGSYGGNITLSGDSTFGVTGAGSLTLSGTISDGGSGVNVTTIGTNTSGPLVLSNNNTFGNFNLLSGTTQALTASAVGSGNVTLGNTTGALNATLQLGGSQSFTLNNNITVQAGNTGVMTLGGINPASTTVTYAGSTTFNKSVTLDAANAGAITAFSGGINDNGPSIGVTKGPGAGTVQLQSNNNYTGPTVINGGVLQFEASSLGGGAVSVNATGTLAGFGGNNVTISGNVVVNSGGAIAPGGIGNTTGNTNLTLGGNLTLNNGSALEFDFASGGAGPALENIVFNSGTGTFTINGNPSVILTNGPTVPGAYTLINMTSDSGNLPSNSALAAIAITPTLSGATYSLQDGTGNDLGDIDLIVTGGSAASAIFTPNGVNPIGGNAPAYSFNTPANWNTGVVPSGSGSSATFPSITAGSNTPPPPVNTAAVSLDAAQHIGTLNLNPGAGFSYAFSAGSGGSLAIDTNITNSSGANTIAAPVSMLAAGTVFVDTSSDSASSLTITNAGSFNTGFALTKTGSGVFNIAGPATISNGATVSGGTLQLSNTGTGASANVLAGPFSVASGATLRGSSVASNVSGSLANALAGTSISLANGATLALNPQDTTTAAGLFNRQLAAGTTGLNTSAEVYTASAAATSLVTATTTSLGQINLFASSTAQTGYDLTAKVLIPATGTYTFGLNADDGARLFIDGQLAVNDDTGGGKAQTGSTANTVQQTGVGMSLSAGYHDFNLEYTNTGGTGAVEVTYTGAGSINGTLNTTKVTTQTALTGAAGTPAVGAIGSGLLQPVIQTAAYNPLPNAIVLTNNVSLAVGVGATIDVGSTNAAGQFFVGVELNPASGTALTLGNGATLNVIGSAGALNPAANLDAGQFLASTSTLLSGGGTITVNNAPDFYAGGLSDGGTPVNLVKTGTGQLVLDNTIGAANSLVTGSTVTIQQGRLHLYGVTNPLGSAGLILAGTGANTPDVVLDTHSSSYTLDNPITVSSNAKIEDWNDTLTTTLGGINGTSIASGATLTYDAIGGASNGSAAGATLTLAGVLTGSGAIAVQSTDYGSTTTFPGIVIFQNANDSFSGGLTINSGTVTASANAVANSSVLGTGTITLATPTAGVPTLLNLLSNSTGSSLGTNIFTTTFGGTTPSPVTVTGTGATTVNVNNNGLNTGNTEALGTLTIGSSTLNVTGANSYNLSLPAVSLTGTPTFVPSTANLFLGPITGTGTQGVTVAGTGTGTVFFNGAANYTGPLMMTSGAAKLGVANAINPASALLSYGGTLDLNGFSPTVASWNVISGPGSVITNTGASPSTLTVTGGTNTFSGNLTDGTSAKTAVVLNGGTTQFTAQSTYTGGLTVNSGATLVSNNVSAVQNISPFGTNSVNLNGGSLSLAGQLPLVGGLVGQFKQDTGLPLVANYTTQAALNGYFAGLTPTVTANTTLNGKTNFDYSNVVGTTTFTTGAIFGTSPPTATTANYGFTGALNYDARFSGFINITTAGTYTFSTQSDDGSVLYIGNQNTPVVSNAAFQGATTKTGTFTFPAVGVYPITIGYFQGTGGTGLLVAMTPPGGTSATLLQSQVESAGSTFNAAQTYTTALNITGNSSIAVSNSLAAGIGPVSIGSNTLSLTSADTSGSPYTLTTGAVTLSGSPTFSVANSASNGAGTLSLPGISGGATNGITTVGPAILAVTGPSTYGGNTNIQGGTLLASNTTGSATGTGAVNVGDSSNANAFQGVLGGTGTVGAVNVFKGSTVSAGTNSNLTPGATSAVGALTSSQQTWSGGGNYTWKLANAATAGGTAGTPGSDWDLLSMTTLTLNASSSNPFNINLQALNGTVNNFNAGNTYTWEIAHAGDGSFTNLSANTLAQNFVLNSSSLNTALGTSPANYALITAPDAGGSELDVVYSAAPEPTSLAMLGLAAGGLLIRRRRRVK